MVAKVEVEKGQVASQANASEDDEEEEESIRRSRASEELGLQEESNKSTIGKQKKYQKNLSLPQSERTQSKKVGMTSMAVTYTSAIPTGSSKKRVRFGLMWAPAQHMGNEGRGGRHNKSNEWKGYASLQRMYCLSLGAHASKYWSSFFFL